MSRPAIFILSFLTDHIHHTFDDLADLAQKMGVSTQALLHVLDRFADYNMPILQHNTSTITIQDGSWVSIAQNAVQRMYVLMDRSTLDTGEIVLRRKTPPRSTEAVSSHNTPDQNQKYSLENQGLTKNILTQNLFERKLQRKQSEKRLILDQSQKPDSAATINPAEHLDDKKKGQKNHPEKPMDFIDPLSTQQDTTQDSNSPDDSVMDRKINFPFLDPCDGSTAQPSSSSTEVEWRQMETCVQPPDRLEKNPSLPETTYRFGKDLDPYIPILQAYNLGRAEVDLPEYPLNRATLLQFAWCAKQGEFTQSDFLRAIHMRIDQYKHHQCGLALVSLQSLCNPKYLRNFLDWLNKHPGYNPKGMTKTRVQNNYKPINVQRLQRRHITQDMIQTLQHKPPTHRSQQEQAEVTAMYQSLLASLANKKMLKIL